jgi:hypothetical protein
MLTATPARQPPDNQPIVSPSVPLVSRSWCVWMQRLLRMMAIRVPWVLSHATEVLYASMTDVTVIATELGIQSQISVEATRVVPKQNSAVLWV